MPMLAASAAARLAAQVLARLQSPHSLGGGGRGPHPVVLWREVARRIGYAPASTRSENVAHAKPSGQAVVPFGGPALSAPPAPQFVWRTRPAAEDSSEPAVWTPFRLGSAAPRSVGESIPIPVPRPIVPSAGKQVSSDKPAQPAPPVLSPAVTVRIEYVPTPAAMSASPAPILPQLPLIPPALLPVVQRRAIEPTAPLASPERILTASMNQALAPTTDLLSRMIRPASVDVPTPSSSVAGPNESAQAAQRVLTPEPALNSHTPSSPPEMPLAQAQFARAATELNDPFASLPSPRQNTFGRILERIVGALPLPEAIRRIVRPPAAEPAAQIIRPAESIVQPATMQPPQVSSDISSVPQATSAAVEALDLTHIEEATAPAETVARPLAQNASGSDLTPRQPVHLQSSESQVLVNRGPSGLLGSLLSRLRPDTSERNLPTGPVPLTLPWKSKDQVAESSELLDDEPEAASLSPLPARFSTAASPSEATSTASFDAGLPPAVPAVPAVSQIVQPQYEPSTNTPVVAVPPVGAQAASTRTNLDTYTVPEDATNETSTANSSIETGSAETMPVWVALPEMAQTIADAHAPLPDAANNPAMTAPTANGLVSRILARLGLSAASNATSSAQPMGEAFDLTLPAIGGSIAQQLPSSRVQSEAAGVSSLLPVARATAREGASTEVATSPYSVTSQKAPAQSRVAEVQASSSAGTVHRLNSMMSRLAAMTAPLAVAPAASAARNPYLGVLRSANQMIHIAQVSDEADANSLEDAADYLSVLNKLYADSSPGSTLPLAVPFSGFAAPTERQSYFASDMQDFAAESSLFDHAQDDNTPLGGLYADESDPMRLAAQTLAERAGLREAGAGFGMITDYSWGDAEASPSATAEAGMWADVIAGGIGAQSGGASNNVALALAGAERAAPESEQRPPNEDRSQGPNLDDLADTIYSIIRQRLAIERERNFS